MLRGCVGSRYLKQVAQELAIRIPGVNAVVNEIELRGARIASRGERSPGRQPSHPTMRIKMQTSIVRRKVEIDDAFGLRMRTAAAFICLAGRFQSDVWVIHEGRRYNGKSMRDMLNMVAERGSRLELEAEGPDAEEAVEALALAVRPPLT